MGSVTRDDLVATIETIYAAGLDAPFGQRR